MAAFKTPSSKFILLSCTCLVLGACGTAQNHASSPEQRGTIDAALSRAADESSEKGNTAQSIIITERLYKRNPKDPDAAVKYAKALREAEYYNRASIVLLPFTQGEKTNAEAQTENAAVQLALGNYVSAEKSAQKAILQDEINYQAFHYLGIALDAQGMHKEAERAFRKGLDNWQGDPTPIINNLALNLASQGYLDEALELLEKALAVSPDRTELERNHRIISALQKTPHHPTPPPRPKPKPAMEEKKAQEKLQDEPVAKAEVTPVTEEEPAAGKTEAEAEEKHADAKEAKETAEEKTNE